MLLAALFGFAFGFLGSMPLAGPIAVLVFARGLARAYRSGAAVAGGAAIAEAGYAFLAYWGMSELVSRYPLAVLVSKGAAVAILFALGVAFLLRQAGAPGGGQAADGEEQVRSSFTLGLGITALNPTFLATWSAAVAVLHSTGLVPPTPEAGVPFALSAGLGIFAWFLVMLALLRRGEGRLRPATVALAIRVVGVALLAMGLWAAADFARALAG